MILARTYRACMGKVSDALSLCPTTTARRLHPGPKRTFS